MDVALNWNFSRCAALKAWKIILPLKKHYLLIHKVYRKVRNKSRGFYFFFAIFSAALIRVRLLLGGGYYWADFKIHFPRLMSHMVP